MQWYIFRNEIRAFFFSVLSFCVLTTFTKLNVKFIRVYPYLTYFLEFLFFFLEKSYSYHDFLDCVKNCTSIVSPRKVAPPVRGFPSRLFFHDAIRHQRVQNILVISNVSCYHQCVDYSVPI